MKYIEDKTADEKQVSKCDDCSRDAVVWAHDSNGDERLLCFKHSLLYRDWRLEAL